MSQRARSIAAEALHGALAAGLLAAGVASDSLWLTLTGAIPLGVMAIAWMLMGGTQLALRVAARRYRAAARRRARHSAAHGEVIALCEQIEALQERITAAIEADEHTVLDWRDRLGHINASFDGVLAARHEGAMAGDAEREAAQQATIAALRQCRLMMARLAADLEAA